MSTIKELNHHQFIEQQNKVVLSLVREIIPYLSGSLYLDFLEVNMSFNHQYLKEVLIKDLLTKFQWSVGRNKLYQEVAKSIIEEEASYILANSLELITDDANKYRLSAIGNMIHHSTDSYGNKRIGENYGKALRDSIIAFSQDEQVKEKCYQEYGKYLLELLELNITSAN